MPGMEALEYSAPLAMRVRVDLVIGAERDLALDKVPHVIPDMLLHRRGNPESLGDVAINGVPGAPNLFLQIPLERGQILVQLFPVLLENMPLPNPFLGGHVLQSAQLFPRWLGGTALSAESFPLDDHLVHIATHRKVFPWFG